MRVKKTCWVDEGKFSEPRLTSQARLTIHCWHCGNVETWEPPFWTAAAGICRAGSASAPTGPPNSLRRAQKATSPQLPAPPRMVQSELPFAGWPPRQLQGLSHALPGGGKGCACLFCQGPEASKVEASVLGVSSPQFCFLPL